MNPAQQQALFENTARSIGGAPKEIQIRHIRNCLKADPAYGKGVADALGLTFSDVSPEDVESTTVVRGDAFPEAIQKAVSIIN